MYICKLEGDHWLNLEQVRSVQVEYDAVTLVKVTWITGESSIYRDKDATLLMEAWRATISPHQNLGSKEIRLTS